MTRTRNAALATLILVPALAVAGCGESEDNDFREGYNAAVKPLSELGSGIGSSIGGAEGKSNAAIEKEFQNLADKAQETHDNLAELDPPDDAKEEFDTLLAALRRGHRRPEAGGGRRRGQRPGEGRPGGAGAGHVGNEDPGGGDRAAAGRGRLRHPPPTRRHGGCETLRIRPSRLLRAPGARAPGCHPLIAGKSITSRIEWRPLISITSLSIPMPIPPVGGMPCSSART